MKISKEAYRMLYVLGLIEILGQKGYVSGKPVSLSDEGREKFGKLVEENFSITKTELDQMFGYFVEQQLIPSDQYEDIMTLVIREGNIVMDDTTPPEKFDPAT